MPGAAAAPSAGTSWIATSAAALSARERAAGRWEEAVPSHASTPGGVTLPRASVRRYAGSARNGDDQGSPQGFWLRSVDRDFAVSVARGVGGRTLGGLLWRVAQGLVHDSELTDSGSTQRLLTDQDGTTPADQVQSCDSVTSFAAADPDPASRGGMARCPVSVGTTSGRSACRGRRTRPSSRITCGKR